MVFSIKVKYGEEMKNISVSEEKFQTLKTYLTSLFQLDSQQEKEMKIKYKDEEDDWILMTSDSELAMALEINKEQSFLSLILETVPPKHQPPTYEKEMEKSETTETETQNLKRNHDVMEEENVESSNKHTQYDMENFKKDLQEGAYFAKGKLEEAFVIFKENFDTHAKPKLEEIFNDPEKSGKEAFSVFKENYDTHAKPTLEEIFSDPQKTAGRIGVAIQDSLIEIKKETEKLPPPKELADKIVEKLKETGHQIQPYWDSLKLQIEQWLNSMFSKETDSYNLSMEELTTFPSDNTNSDSNINVNTKEEENIMPNATEKKSLMEQAKNEENSQSSDLMQVEENKKNKNDNENDNNNNNNKKNIIENEFTIKSDLSNDEFIYLSENSKNEPSVENGKIHNNPNLKMPNFYNNNGEYIYKEQLESLKNMGFQNEENVLEILLNKHNGNVQLVVENIVN